MDDKRKVTLGHPFTVKIGEGAVEVREVEVPTAVKAKHLRRMPDSLMDSIMDGKKIYPKDMVAFIAAITELPESTIDEIHVDDLTKIGEACASFFGGSPSAGERSSGE